MQAESAVNAVATPTGAPTCPPCVALSAGLAQVSGAHEPGVLGSQPELPGPHASTVPPPVTRQPSSCTHSGGCGVMFSHCPVLGLHTWQTGLAQVGGGTWVCMHTPPSQPAVVHALLSAAAHGVLSVTLVVVQRPIRPASTPVPCRVGSQMEVRHGVPGGHGTTVLGTDVEPIGTPVLGGVPVKDSAAVKSMRAVILPLTTSWLRT